MMIVLGIVGAICAFALMLSSALDASTAQTISYGFLIAAIVVFACCGAYFAAIPHYSLLDRNPAVAVSIAIAIPYTALIICCIVAMAIGSIGLQNFVAGAFLINILISILGLMFVLR